MKSAFLSVLLVGLPFFVLAAEQPTYFVSNSYYDEDNRTRHLVDFGYNDGKLAFVVFQKWDGTAPQSSRSVLHLRVKSDPKEPGVAYVLKGWIQMPDGSKRDLPSSKMAYEYTNGVFRASAPVDMTVSHFSRYLSNVEKTSPRELFTVAALKRFEEDMKTKSSNHSVEPTPTR